MTRPIRRGTTRNEVPETRKVTAPAGNPATRPYAEMNVPRKPSTTRAIRESYGDADSTLELLPYVAIATRSPSENSDIVRRGIPAGFIKRLAVDLGIDQSTLTDHMGIARSTFSRKLKNDETLSNGDGAIALGVARIIGEVARILHESGDPAQMGESFHVAEWTGTWLKQPVGALGNRCPLDYLDNAFGQETVLQLIRQMQSGAFA